MYFKQLLKKRMLLFQDWKKELEKKPNQDLEERSLFINAEKSLLPNSYCYIYNLVDGRVSYSAGMNLLEFGRSTTQRLQMINSKYHNNQFDLIAFETFSLFTHCLNYLTKDFYFFSQRAIKIVNGNYWLAHQYSVPAILDSKSRFLSYISTVVLIKKYEGEPYRSTVGLALNARQDNDKRKELIRLFNQVKEESLLFFEPKEKNRKILLGYLKGEDTSEIAKVTGIKLAKIYSYKRTLKKKLHKLFPECDKIVINNDAAIIYLRQMFNLLGKPLDY